MDGWRATALDALPEWDMSQNCRFFESNWWRGASHMCRMEGTHMKIGHQVAFASLVFCLASLMPASALASSKEASAHTHSLTSHDRTPHVHAHVSHSHHG